MYIRKKCEKDDIWLIRDFIQESYKLFDEKVNWHIDRLNFTYSVSRIMNGVSEAKYRDDITMYIKDDVLEAVLITEGENRGEAFFEIKTFALDETLKKMMFDDVEELIKSSAHDFVQLRLPSEANLLIEEAVARGYEKVEWSEVTMKKLLIDIEDESLPESYTFVNNFNFKEKAEAHAYAFGYYENQQLILNAAQGLEVMTYMPDYKSEFDISIGKDGVEVGFATMWYDSKNQIGILEPVGTHKDHRRLGLGKAAINRGCNMIKALGATAVYVGSDQEFYKALGFSPVSTDYVYKKSLK
ncbi:MAG: GNAT family N-acetyltransferase [Clostridiales bacterium]|nr:GNAT family N-acetyltransferase [Clostridiales bacterium]